MKTGIDTIKAAAARLGEQPGVYRMIGDEGKILYIGKARNLKKRVSQYTNLSRLPTRLQRMVARTRKVEFTITRTEAEALLLEANLIKTHQPPFNLMLKDDKSYPYIRIEVGHEFPRISKYRGKTKGNDEYFGPYANVDSVNKSISLLQKLFLLRPCKDSYFANRSKPCLQYQIKRCSAPCVDKISQPAYAALLDDARAFLTGKAGQVQERLAAEMEAASAKLDFETAAILRDRIKALAAVRQEQHVYVEGLDNADVVALHSDGADGCVQIFSFRQGQNLGGRSYFIKTDGLDDAEIMRQFISQFYLEHELPGEIYVMPEPAEAELLATALSIKQEQSVVIITPRRGAKKDVADFVMKNAVAALEMRLADKERHYEQLAAVQEIFGLKRPINRVEIYDNSHISGQYSLGAMVVAGPDGFIKKAYRIFNAREARPADDYDLMREVMRRRFRNGGEDLPDLMIIDGGAGQLSVVNAELEELGVNGISVVAMAKGPDRNAGREEFHIKGRKPFILEPGSPALHLLQRMRDEAHRFAIGSHRKRRGKGMTRSKLDETPGIGSVRRKLLLNRFGSIQGIAEASVEEICKTGGIGKKTAVAILGHLNGAV